MPHSKRTLLGFSSLQKINLHTVFKLISPLYTYLFQNSKPSSNYSVDSDQLASNEAS